MAPGSARCSRSCCFIAARSSRSIASSTSSGASARRRPRRRRCRSTSRGCARRSARARSSLAAAATRSSWAPIRSTSTASSDWRPRAAPHSSAATRAPPRSSLRAALDLWRGPPLADFAYESFAQNEIARLEEVRLAALEDRVDADLALGRHAALVARARGPGGPSTRRASACAAQLMLALYRSGRQAEALDELPRRAADRSIEELGLEPGPELQRLERAILAQDPEIGAPTRARPVAELRRRRRGGVADRRSAAACCSRPPSRRSSPPTAARTRRRPSANTLAVIDPESDELVATVPTGIEPTDVSADADSVWVANRGDDTVTQDRPRDPDRRAARPRPAPASAGWRPAPARCGSATAGGAKLVRLDPASGRRRSIRLAARTERVRPRPESEIAVGDGAVWVGEARRRASRGSIRDSDEVVAEVPVGNGPSAIATGARRRLGRRRRRQHRDPDRSRERERGHRDDPGRTGPGRGRRRRGRGVGRQHAGRHRRADRSRRPAAVTETIAVGARPTGHRRRRGRGVGREQPRAARVSRIDPETNEVEATVAVGEAPQDVTVAHDRVWVTRPGERRAARGASRSHAEDDVARVLSLRTRAPPTRRSATSTTTSDVGATCALLYNYPDRPFPVGARLQPEVAAGPAVRLGRPADLHVHAARRAFASRRRRTSRSPPTAFERAIERVLAPDDGLVRGELASDIVGAEDYTAGVAAERRRGARARRHARRSSSSDRRRNLVDRLATPWFCAVPPDTPIDREGVDLAALGGPLLRRLVRPRPIASCCAGIRTTPGTRPQELEEIRYEIGVSPESAIEQVEAGEADYVGRDSARVARAVAGDAVRRLAAALRAGQRGRASRAPAALHPARADALTTSSSTPTAARSPTRGCAGPSTTRSIAARSPINTGIGAAGKADRPVHPAGDAGVRGRGDLPARRPRPRHGAPTRRRRERARASSTRATLPGAPATPRSCARTWRAIGIELDVRQFPLGEFFEPDPDAGRALGPRLLELVLRLRRPGHLHQRPVRGRRRPRPPSRRSRDPAADGRRGAAERRRAAACLRASSTATSREQAVPAVPFASGTITHFLSARMGCQVLHPIYGLDLAALCVRDDGDAE